MSSRAACASVAARSLHARAQHIVPSRERLRRRSDDVSVASTAARTGGRLELALFRESGNHMFCRHAVAESRSDCNLAVAGRCLLVNKTRARNPHKNDKCQNCAHRPDTPDDEERDSRKHASDNIARSAQVLSATVPEVLFAHGYQRTPPVRATQSSATCGHRESPIVQHPYASPI